MLKPRPVAIRRIHFLDAIISAGADRSAAVLRHHSIIKPLTVGNFLDSRHLLTLPEIQGPLAHALPRLFSEAETSPVKSEIPFLAALS